MFSCQCEGANSCAPMSWVLQRKYSVVKIEVSQTYDNGRPKLNGLSDPRLGTMDRGIICSTDGCNVQDSPGYFGHIELAKPMFHIGFLSTVVKVLRCVSYHTSRLLLDKVSCVTSSGWSTCAFYRRGPPGNTSSGLQAHGMSRWFHTPPVHKKGNKQVGLATLHTSRRVKSAMLQPFV